MSYGLRYVDQGILKADFALFARDLLTPFGHLAWTGLAAAVAFGVWQRRGRVVVTLPVVGALLTAILLHSAYDSVMAIPGWPVLLKAVAYIATLVVSYWLFHRVTRDLRAAPQPRPA